MDHQVNRERRVTGVFLVLPDLLVPKETAVLPAHLVHWVPLVHQDYLVPLVLKELKVHLVQLDQRERLAHLDPLDLQGLLVMSFSRCPFKVP